MLLFGVSCDGCRRTDDVGRHLLDVVLVLQFAHEEVALVDEVNGVLEELVRVLLAAVGPDAQRTPHGVDELARRVDRPPILALLVRHVDEQLVQRRHERHVHVGAQLGVELRAQRAQVVHLLAQSMDGQHEAGRVAHHLHDAVDVARAAQVAQTRVCAMRRRQ